MQNRANGGAGPRLCLAPCAAGILIGLLSLYGGGCAASRPDPQAESSATRAVGLDEALVFKTEGGPLDESWGDGGGETGQFAADEAMTLTLAEAVRRAVTTDPGLQAALARVRIAMADADQARLLPNPVLNFVLRWGPGKPQVEVSLAQDLIQAFQIPRRASAADHRLHQAAADAVSVALDVAAEVQERYAGVQALDTLIPLLQERLVLLRKLTDTARARREAGEGTRTEVAILDSQRVELEVEIAAAELQRREERIRLARLIGRPSAATAWTLEAWSSPALAAEPESRWVDAALSSRPEVQSVAWQLAALGDDYALARLLPWQGAGAGISSQQTEDGNWFTGPSVTTPIPVFDTGRARRARVTAEQIEARHNLTLAKRKVVEEVRVAYQTLAAGRANLDRIRNELIPLQQERRQVTEDVYLVERDVTPLILAEQDLRTAQARAIDAERQVTISLIRLQRAVGGPGVARTVGSAPSEPPSIAPESAAPHAAALNASLTATPHAATDSRRSTR
jgi:outer membrane protein, heavy metal efflux system